MSFDPFDPYIWGLATITTGIVGNIFSLGLLGFFQLGLNISESTKSICVYHLSTATDGIHCRLSRAQADDETSISIIG
jgi:hypothetical protein